MGLSFPCNNNSFCKDYPPFFPSSQPLSSLVGINGFNGTIRERFAPLTRKCRYAASQITTVHTGIYLIGCVYNFCSPHYELSKSKTKGGFGFSCTPAIASGLTDHVWSVKELLTYKVAPPPLPIPKKRGCPRTKTLKNMSVSKKPFLRLRKGALCASTR